MPPLNMHITKREERGYLAHIPTKPYILKLERVKRYDENTYQKETTDYEMRERVALLASDKCETRNTPTKRYTYRCQG